MSSLLLSDLNIETICHDLFAFVNQQGKQSKTLSKAELKKQNDEFDVDQRTQKCQNLKQWYQLKESQFLGCSMINISQEKQFIWDANREQQLWYKNLVIPTIKVSFPFSQISSKIPKISAKIRCFKQLENNTFKEVELTGELEQDVKDDKPLFFSGIKFLETTFISRVLIFFQSFFTNFNKTLKILIYINIYLKYIFQISIF
ncbi:hypothetical protein TTHERM_000355149 (macronuclear) [Tetrahymena thermophila SB210]|uniref:Uncharacterized protein n=1 Tax=Tetrahymena thermophila (strain SB210) TaxID=312017 RepID=W7XJ75_TETTS|nr:hypothetical protein TTHERM_000355149 [Tetrahymena thermophila SB210]EWS75281.1 hypothetical protein TTHERM_000355149 [Tetrahymena thermophila SB210]|eukprot:XP_012652272.1 hypothetical protein TTHERM_000355149 [Tetrahymena thermophila SB210]